MKISGVRYWLCKLSFEIPDKCDTGHAVVKLNPRPLCAYSNAQTEKKFQVLQVINAYSVGFYDTLPFELMCTVRLSI